MNGGTLVGKKIVVLNGSPRRKGNTSALVRKFTEGAESAEKMDKIMKAAQHAPTAVNYQPTEDLYSEKHIGS